MFGVFIFLISASITLLTLSQTVTISILYKDELTLGIDFLYMRLSLSPSQKKPKKQKKNESMRQKVDKVSKIATILSNVISASDVEIREISLPSTGTSPAVLYLKKHGIASIAYFFISLIRSRAGRLYTTDLDLLADNASDKPAFDVLIRISLFHLILSVVMGLFGKKRKIKLKSGY